MDNDQITELYGEIAQGLRDVVFEADGPIVLSVRFADGTYKRKTIGARDVFFLDSIYSGKVQTFIARLRPEDPTPEYEFVEVDPRNADDAFPTLLEELNKWAVARYGTSFVECSDLRVFSQMVLVAEQHHKKSAVKSDLEELKDHPDFGIF